TGDVETEPAADPSEQFEAHAAEDDRVGGHAAAGWVRVGLIVAFEEIAVDVQSPVRERLKLVVRRAQKHRPVRPTGGRLLFLRKCGSGNEHREDRNQSVHGPVYAEPQRQSRSGLVTISQNL